MSKRTMYLSETAPDGAALRQSALEVEIWEGYLKNKSNIARALRTYSLDNGPLHESAHGTFLFRFTHFDWQNKIQELVTRNNIHYEVVGMVGIDPMQQLLKKKIFIAEDDEGISDCLTQMLQDAGYHVKLSSSGKAILEGCFSSVDLFILDRKMPDLDGLELCRLLRLRSETKDTPVIMISAQPKAGNEALLAGANDYLEKPFHMHYLLNVVSKYTRGRK